MIKAYFMADFSYFSHNGALLPVDQAVIPLGRVEYSYGFGVYETIRTNKGGSPFLDQHCKRLMQSAVTLEIEHNFTAQFVKDAVLALIHKNDVQTCNIKILLIGGNTADDADLYIQCLNPLFADRKLYKTGAHSITEHYERMYPSAKSLNMLPSYLAYRRAKRAGAYDAILINNEGCITEGSRTNFYAIRGKTIFSAPADEVLPGVTRDNVLRVAKQHGYELIEQPLPLADIQNYDGAFLTNTSSKIMPLKSIDDFSWPSVTPSLLELIEA